METKLAIHKLQLPDFSPGFDAVIKATCDIHEESLNIFIPIRKASSSLERTKPLRAKDFILIIINADPIKTRPDQDVMNKAIKEIEAQFAI